MPDWGAFVGERLARLGLGAGRDEEIRAELTEHLEDAYQHALDRGHSPEEAMAFAREQVPDWQDLAQTIRTASEETDMTNTAKTIWIPGTSVLVFSLMVLMVLTGMIPPRMWQPGSGPVVLYSVWMLSYLALGALGAFWSRRAGGNASARFFSGVFPLTMHVAALLLAVLAGSTSAGLGSRFGEYGHTVELLKLTLVWIALPGIMLSLGTLPFLRKERG